MRLKTLFPALILLLTVSAYGAEAEDHILSGSKFVQDKSYKEAVREFELAVKLAPDDPDANRLLGLALLNTGDSERAAEYTLKSAKLKPIYPAYYLLGLIYSSQGYAHSSPEKYGQAIEAYEEALKLNPTSYEARHQLGKVQSMLLHFDKAVEAYRKAAELNPKFPDAFQGLGSAYYWSGDLTAALQQVDALNKLGFTQEATELERWIKDKESKKKKAARKAGASEAKQPD